MFEHKELDGSQNRLIPATEEFVSGEVLECLYGQVTEADKNNRIQFGVIGDRLVERGLPPASIGDYWSFDAPAVPWWSTVNNPPHAGLVAEFNKHSGGQYRVPLDVAHNIVAFAAAGEEVTLTDGSYKVVRKSDDTELTATSTLELRKLYFA
jgi:hypothetical protein